MNIKKRLFFLLVCIVFSITCFNVLGELKGFGGDTITSEEANFNSKDPQGYENAIESEDVNTIQKYATQNPALVKKNMPESIVLREKIYEANVEAFIDTQRFATDHPGFEFEGFVTKNKYSSFRYNGKTGEFFGTNKNSQEKRIAFFYEFNKMQNTELTMGESGFSTTDSEGTTAEYENPISIGMDTSPGGDEIITLEKGKVSMDKISTTETPIPIQAGEAGTDPLIQAVTTFGSDIQLSSETESPTTTQHPTTQPQQLPEQSITGMSLEGENIRIDTATDSTLAGSVDSLKTTHSDGSTTTIQDAENVLVTPHGYFAEQATVVEIQSQNSIYHFFNVENLRFSDNQLSATHIDSSIFEGALLSNIYIFFADLFSETSIDGTCSDVEFDHADTFTIGFSSYENLGDSSLKICSNKFSHGILSSDQDNNILEFENTADPISALIEAYLDKNESIMINYTDEGIIITPISDSSVDFSAFPDVDIIFIPADLTSFPDLNLLLSPDYISELVNQSIAFTTSDFVSLLDRSFLPDSSNFSATILNTQPGGTTEYLINNATLIYSNEEFTETIIANNTVTTTIDEVEGIECVQLSPHSSYIYSYREDIKKDFAIKAKEEPFELCFNKLPDDNFQANTDNQGVFDFIREAVFFNGKIEYYRYRIKDDQLTSLNLEPLYQGFLKQNSFMQLEELTMIPTLNLEFIDIYNSTITQTQPNDYLTIIEYPGILDVRRFAKIQKELNSASDSLITNYQDATIENNIYRDGRIKIYPPAYPDIAEELK